MELRVVRVRWLKPGTRKCKIKMQGIVLVRLDIETVKTIFLVAPVMERLEFRRVEKTRSIHSTQ